MNVSKRLERFSKRGIRALLRRFLRTERIAPSEVDLGAIARILVVRQDSRLGNLVLMTPLLSALKAVFPESEVDALISEGFEEVLTKNPNVDHTIVFRKKDLRRRPLRYLDLVRELKDRGYDLAIDVSDGHHFSLNGALLTRLSGARYRAGYDRGDADTFLNVLVPPPPPDIPMAEGVQRVLREIAPGTREYPTVFYVGEDDRAFAQEWCLEREITEYDSLFVIHPGGKRDKRWGERNFASLIDRIAGVTGARIVVAAGGAEVETAAAIKTLARSPFDILEGVTVGQMAALIARSDLFVSGDTGPMHLAVALGRPVIAIFTAGNPRVYGPRAKNSRVVTGDGGVIPVDDVVNAIWSVLSIDPDSEE